ncbi:Protein of unknown function [Pyronema omphalodes CBS 100304]|uniref:Uncharacterized protein n=1 Tax=Pyronema omphalodes (strain CBS 100304) TaxID=1076935 RepID=U4LJ07_PYROM|nr:Protein of unknown function [Pyronema omphalodes CBS 100304]
MSSSESKKSTAEGSNPAKEEQPAAEKDPGKTKDSGADKDATEETTTEDKDMRTEGWRETMEAAKKADPSTLTKGQSKGPDDDEDDDGPDVVPTY